MSTAKNTKAAGETAAKRKTEQMNPTTELVRISQLQTPRGLIPTVDAREPLHGPLRP